MILPRLCRLHRLRAAETHFAQPRFDKHIRHALRFAPLQIDQRAGRDARLRGGETRPAPALAAPSLPSARAVRGTRHGQLELLVGRRVAHYYCEHGCRHGEVESSAPVVGADHPATVVGAARDAAGRGLKIILAEQGDLAGGTSSASTKLMELLRCEEDAVSIAASWARFGMPKPPPPTST